MLEAISHFQILISHFSRSKNVMNSIPNSLLKSANFRIKHQDYKNILS